MRAFIAIELPDEPRRHLQDVQKSIALLGDLAGKLTLEPAEKLHLTLKFLGEVSPPQATELIASLHKLAIAPMTLHGDRLDCFPPRGPIRVVTASLAGDIQALGGMVSHIEQRCQDAGFEPERRPYRPHITLARARNGAAAALRQLLAAASQSAWPGPEFSVSRFVLLQSILKHTGSEYRVVESFTGLPGR